MGPFILVRLAKYNVNFSTGTSNAMEGYCPHCKKIIISSSESYAQDIPFPTKCKYCGGEIDPRGVTYYHNKR